MATTIAEVTERVFRRIAHAQNEQAARLYLPDIEAQIPLECDLMASDAIRSPGELRQYLTKSYTVAESSSTWPLSPHADLQVESVPAATVTHPDSAYPLEYLASSSDFEFYEQTPGFFYYTIENEVIRIRDDAGQADIMTGNLTIRNAVFEPVVAATSGSTTLPEQLETILVDRLVAWAERKMGSAGAGDAGA